MSGFGDVRAEIAGKLTAAGLPGTVDPGALPPFVLVEPARSTSSSSGGGVGSWPVEIPVRIAVPAPGDANAVAELERMLETVLVTLGAAPFDYGLLTLAGDKQVPAYTVRYPRAIPNPNC